MSFIEEKRREQIIDAAIRVLARGGVAHASLSRIAAEAGIAKSIISYHFAGKDALFEQVFATVSARVAAALMPSFDGLTTPWDFIAAYIAGQIAYMRDHRDALLAIGHLALSHTGTADTPDYIAAASSEEHDLLRGWLAEGQRTGSFHAFDPGVMATMISAAIEGVLSRWATDPATDLDHYSREVLDLFGHATRRDRP